MLRCVFCISACYIQGTVLIFLMKPICLSSRATIIYVCMCQTVLQRFWSLLTNKFDRLHFIPPRLFLQQNCTLSDVRNSTFKTNFNNKSFIRHNYSKQEIFAKLIMNYSFHTFLYKNIFTLNTHSYQSIASLDMLYL